MLIFINQINIRCTNHEFLNYSKVTGYSHSVFQAGLNRGPGDQGPGTEDPGPGTEDPGPRTRHRAPRTMTNVMTQ